MLTTPEPLGAVAPAHPLRAVSCCPAVTAKVPVTDDAGPPDPPESLLAAPPPPPPTAPLVVTWTAVAPTGTVVVDWMLHAWVSVQEEILDFTWVPNEYWSATTGVVVPVGVVTVTSTVPEPAGEVAVIDEAESAVMVPAWAPKSTAVALARFDPVMVTLVPPAVEPVTGLIEVRVGGGTITV